MADFNRNGTPGADYSDRGNYNDVNFNPALAVLFVGMFTFIFLVVVFLVCICNRSNVGEGSRIFRRPGANNNVRGLERTVIESFPVFSYSLVKGLKSQANGSECAVCLSDFGDDEMVRLLPKCSHAFHPECIDMWLCSHTTCPLCRISLAPGEDSTPPATAEPRTTPEQLSIVVDDGNNDAPPDTGNDSTGHALVMVRPKEWCIATPRGLTPGLYRSCSFVAGHHSQAASTSNAPTSKMGGSVDDGRRGSKSERWGIGSKNIPSSILRSFSERGVVQPGEQASQRDYLRRTFSWVMRREGEGSQNRSVSSRHDQIAV